MTDPAGSSATDAGTDADWQRLDPRMLLVHPVREVLRFLPALLVFAVSSTAATGRQWQLVAVVFPVALGLLRYLTTSYRITAGRIELRRGLLNRHVLSTPVDRVRTVDLTSSPIHRVLGLTTVRIGTGTASTNDEDRIDLDGLPVDRARALREQLVSTSGAGHPSPGTPAAALAGAPLDRPLDGRLDGPLDGPAAGPPAPARDVVVFDPAWLRYAPLTASGVVMAVAALGALSQLLDALGGFERVDPAAVDLPGVPVWAVAVGLVLALLVVVSVLSVVGYLVTHYGFRLTRTRGAAAWHLTRGLFTTRETTLDDARVAGVDLAEPIGLRAAGGARLSAIVTGVDRSETGSSALVPPAPLPVVAQVAREVLDTADPVDTPLTPHGPRAAGRRWTRALLAALGPAAAGPAALALGAPAWALATLVALPLAAALAHDRVRSLGHALVAGHLVARSGSVVRRRRMIEVDHVIGWSFRATWFQRRAGLTTLVATTAGGNQAVTVLDVPEDEAVRLAHAALPDLVGQFRAGFGGSPAEPAPSS